MFPQLVSSCKLIAWDYPGFMRRLLDFRSLNKLVVESHMGIMGRLEDLEVKIRTF